MKIKCVVCGHENAEGMKFCVNCGSPLDQPSSKLSQAIDDISEERTVLLDPRAMEQQMRREPPPPPAAPPPPPAAPPRAPAPPPPPAAAAPSWPPPAPQAPPPPPPPTYGVAGGYGAPQAPPPPPPPTYGVAGGYGAPQAPPPPPPPAYGAAGGYSAPQAPGYGAPPPPPPAAPGGFSPAQGGYPPAPAGFGPPMGGSDFGGETEFLEPAGFGARFVAYLIDNILLSVVGCVIGFVFGLAAGLSSGMDSQSVATGVQLVANALGMLVSAAYFTFMIGAKGQTVGKMVMGLKVLRADGGEVGFGLAFLRWIGYLISSVICLIGFIMAGFRDDRKALHDLIFSTQVVKIR